MYSNPGVRSDYVETSESLRLMLQKAAPLSDGEERRYREFQIELNAAIETSQQLLLHYKRVYDRFEKDVNELCLVRGMLQSLKGQKHADPSKDKS